MVKKCTKIYNASAEGFFLLTFKTYRFAAISLPSSSSFLKGTLASTTATVAKHHY